jgi:anti-sigma B factor antagonist
VDITIRKADNATILDLEGPFVMADAPNFKSRVREVLDSGAKHIAVNLAGVSYLDSSGIGAIVGAFSAVKGVGGQCRFFSPSAQVLKVLKMVRLDTVLELRQDEGAALSSFPA